MSVVAIPPSGEARGAAPQHSPAEPDAVHSLSDRRRPGGPANQPTLRVTVDIPLSGDELTPQASRLLEFVRELVDGGDGRVLLAAEPPTQAAAAESPGRAGEPMDTDPAGQRVRPTTATPTRDDPAEGAGQVRVLAGARMVLRDGRPVPFTRREFDLLHFLATNPRRVFTRTQLLTHVWGYQHTVPRTVDVHIRRLRAKIGADVPLVTTVHGVGYRLADDARISVDSAG